MFILFFLCTLISAVVADAATTATTTFADWKKQVEEVLQQNHRWKIIMESAMAQFALASFPDNFTPETFSKGINATLVLDQQKTTLRSRIYHRALSNMEPDLYMALPEGVTYEAAKQVVKELQDKGFTSLWLEKHNQVYLQKKKP